MLRACVRGDGGVYIAFQRVLSVRFGEAIVNIDFLYGVLGLGFWGYFAAVIISLQITIVCVTVYLHRDAAHRSVDLHPAIRHFARFWIWFTASMLTREWVSVHRKHHAKCETVDDPHSPVIYGL
ncbi:MAG TPA: hypothetical protein VK629_19865, partial [Steroidobacteraceae bacterium]|nr:hypothetical protein [Steroidobacteraceae bacterium]